MKKVLIDTNIYSLAMRGDAPIVSALRKIDQIGILQSVSVNFILVSKVATVKRKTEKN